jgi:hypothetical protein
MRAYSTLFEFENQTLVDTECILISSPSLWHLDDNKEDIERNSIDDSFHFIGILG